MTGTVLAAYIAVSVIWGSTYLAIRIGVQHLPPALFGGIRFTAAGLILLVLALSLGKSLPRRPGDWGRSAAVGVLLLTVGNGAVIWAEQYVESGMAAILVVTGALWMAVLDAVIPGSEARPTWRQFAGLAVGFLGVTLLVEGGSTWDIGRLGPMAALVGASASWALGSVYAKRRPVEASPYVHAALQMCAGGIVLLAVAAVAGEFGRIGFSPAGLGAVLYLILFGSIVAYTSFVYLLRHLPAAIVGTHVYVNTVVAVLLGWWILGERVTLRTFVAMAIVLGAVLWVRRAGKPHVERKTEFSGEGVSR